MGSNKTSSRRRKSIKNRLRGGRKSRSNKKSLKGGNPFGLKTYGGPNSVVYAGKKWYKMRGWSYDSKKYEYGIGFYQVTRCDETTQVFESDTYFVDEVQPVFKTVVIEGKQNDIEEDIKVTVANKKNLYEETLNSGGCLKYNSVDIYYCKLPRTER